MKIHLRALPALTLAGIVLTANTLCFADEVMAEAGELDFPGQSLVLPLTGPGIHPLIVVDMGGGKQHQFIVDTGASVNVLDSALAESVGFEIVGKTQIGAPGGPQIPGNIVRAPVAHVGAAIISNAEFVTMDIATFSGGTMQGVLGMGLFRDYLLTYDYGKNEIRVTRESLSPDEPGVVRYNDVDGHIQVDMEVAGETLATHIDTGSMAGFTLPIEMKASLSLKQPGQVAMTARMVGGNRDVQLGQLNDNIVFAGITYAEPNVGFMDPSPGYGNVGGRVLSDFVLSVDQQNHLVRFQKSSPKPVTAAAGKPRRLGVQFRGMPGGGALTVGRVEPASLGERSGLLTGDVLMNLNGKPAKEYDMAALGAIFGGSEPLQLEVERDGQMQTIHIQ